jgi:hypothetical protein
MTASGFGGSVLDNYELIFDNSYFDRGVEVNKLAILNYKFIIIQYFLELTPGLWPPGFSHSRT